MGWKFLQIICLSIYWLSVVYKKGCLLFCLQKWSPFSVPSHIITISTIDTTHWNLLVAFYWIMCSCHSRVGHFWIFLKLFVTNGAKLMSCSYKKYNVGGCLETEWVLVVTRPNDSALINTIYNRSTIGIEIESWVYIGGVRNGLVWRTYVCREPWICVFWICRGKTWRASWGLKVIICVWIPLLEGLMFLHMEIFTSADKTPSVCLCQSES